MNRFRKRSDPKRAHIPVALREGQAPPTEPLPPLPPASDFRTSLILPDLTRRFSVLRNSAGEPIGVDELKSRLEAQRVRGSQHRVSEHEEDMILEALSRLRGSTGRQRSSAGGATDGGGGNLISTYSGDLDEPSRDSVAPSLAGGQSVRSTTTTSSGLHTSPSNASFSSTKGSQASRRMSNNLFGSGKFHDHTYMRNANQRRTPTSPVPARMSSMKHSDSVTSMSISSRAGNNNSMYSDSQSLRPVTPEDSAYTNSVPSSPNKTLSTRDEASDHAVDFQGLGAGLARALSPEVLGRAGLALDEVIREIEEEGDDEVLVERSPIAVTPNNYSHPPEPSSLSASPPSSPADEAGMAFSSDDQIDTDEAQPTSPYPRSRTSSPIPRLPGYIPGMPRPMTPRETSFDADDLTPSATPRATSPRLPGVSPQPPPSLVQSFSSMYRTNSNTSTSRTSRPTSPTAITPVSPSPLFFNRTPNGRFTPEDRARNGSFTPEDRLRNSSSSPAPDPIDSPVLGRRRPLSPLAGSSTFQPISSSSRPSTPSNITWNMPTSPSSTKSRDRNGSVSGHGHSRNGSVVSVSDNTDQSRSSVRSMLSPVLPESPVDLRQASTTSLNMASDLRSPSALSGMESQLYNRSVRSPTPTYGNSHSPTSPTFPQQGAHTNGNGVNGSRRSSRQNAHSSFALSPSHALLLSPIGNASRSSFESAGSSYHSWDEDHTKDRLFNLFSHLDPQSEWHELSVDKSGSSTSRTTPLETQDSEEIVRRQMGLSKIDIVAVQDKLVSVALTKAATPEGRNRANSVRKRRPSTSQSTYSYNGGESRAATPAPQVQAPVAPAPAAPAARNSGQIALLDAVVDSIESPRKMAVAIPPPEESRKPDAPSVLQPQVSSPSMRQRALAEVLFGSEDQESSVATMQIPAIHTPDAEVRPSPEKDTEENSYYDPQTDVQGDRDEGAHYEVKTPSTPTVPLGYPHDHLDATFLAQDVQRRAEAATAALRKSPSIPKMTDTGSTRRRISPSQISSPKLLSASTSVDTIPLPSVQAQTQHAAGNVPGTKLSSRFKKLRGTLRAKTHTADDIVPYTLDVRTPPSTQTATFHPSAASSASPHGVFSATDPAHPKISPPVLPSPPASATPGIRGFMSLFRKQRHGPIDMLPSSDRRGTPLSPPQMIPASVPKHERVAPPPHLPQHHVQSAPPEQTQFQSIRPLSPQSPLSASFQTSEAATEDTIVAPLSALIGQHTPASPTTSTTQVEEAALKQLFDAANDLGLDQAALNALVARSPSLSSRPTIRSKSRSNSVADSRQTMRSDPRESAFSSSPIPSEGRPSIDAVASARPSVEIRQPTPSLNIRKNTESTAVGRLPTIVSDPRNTIVRRTIIVPSDTKGAGFDINALNALMRKQSQKGRRRSAGATSVQSNRSLQDRAPTPPPPRSTGGKRFSTDRTPPVPQLPNSQFSPVDTPLPSQVEQSSSAYDSLYEMYAGDSRAVNVTSNVSTNVTTEGSQPGVDEESGPAVEVIELANGETIWSIVNGLRDDDAESFYDNRRSFASDYSGDGVKVLFKEHARKGSRGSNNSFLSRKKHLQPSPSNRPETKVFFSSSAQIGRLIEGLSRDLDAGSFNITPDHSHGHAAHSASSSVGSVSDMRWTLEERLEHMLGSMSANP